MVDLYDKVERIINAETMDQAEEFLYGVEGIRINTKEYYENIISNFVKRKDIVLPKDADGNIFFDLDNNVNDLWDIVFISQYVQEQWKKERKRLEKEKNRIEKLKNEERDLAKKQELKKAQDDIQKLCNKINEYSDALGKKEKNNKIYIQTGNNISEEQYKEQLNELKKSIVIMQKLRDSFEHRNNNFNILPDNKLIEINNYANNFVVTIPSDYLDGFVKGRIIVKEEDKYIIELTNNIAYPLLEELNYDPKKIESFFYNVDPDFLKLILEQIDYDYEELYKIDEKIFKLEYKDGIKKLLKKGLKFNYIKELPKESFQNADSTIKMIENGIDVRRLNNNIDIYDNRRHFDVKYRCSDSVIRLNNYNKHHDNKINIYELNENAFYHPDETIKMHEIGIDVTKLDYRSFKYPEKVIKFYKEGIDVTKLNGVAFEYYEETIKMHKEGIDVTKLFKEAFEHSEGTIKMYKEGIDVTNLSLYSYDSIFNEFFISNVSFVESAFEMYENVIQLYEYNKTHENKINILKLDEVSLKYFQKTIQLHEKGIDVTGWPKEAFEHIEGTIRMHEEGIDITRLPEPAFSYYEETIEMFKSVIKDEIYDLCDEAFYRFDDTIKMKLEGIDVTKLYYSAFQNVEATIKMKRAGIDVEKLSYITTAEYYNDILQDKKRYVSYKNITTELLNKLDLNYEKGLGFNSADVLIEMQKIGIDVTELPIETFFHPESLLELLRNGIDIKSFLNLTPIYKDIYTNNYVRSNNSIFYNPLGIIKLSEYNKVHDNKINIKKLSSLSFDYYESIIDLHERGIDVTKLQDSAFYYRYKYSDIGGKEFYDFIYKYDFPNTVIKLHNRGIDATKIPFDAFYHPGKIIKLYNIAKKNNVDMNKISNVVFDYISRNNYNKKCIDNIRHILRLNNNNYEQLGELPMEFFTCNKDIVDNMYKTYNSNVAKSIFGINNPKVIGLLVYMNSVFGNYNKNMSNDISINPIEFIHSSFTDTYKYKNNIETEDISVNQESYLNQFIIDKDGNNRNQEEIKNLIVNRLRNSTAHFRFKLVKDKDGKILDDKIYLYDEDKNGNNFNVILDIKSALNITRKVELGIKSTKEKNTVSEISTKKHR